MTREEKKLALFQWWERFQQTEIAFGLLKNAFDADGESIVCRALWDNFTAYSDEFSRRFGDESDTHTLALNNSAKEWLDWYLWENECGKKALSASPGRGVPMRKIKTIEDLLALLEFRNDKL